MFSETLSFHLFNQRGCHLVFWYGFPAAAADKNDIFTHGSLQTYHPAESEASGAGLKHEKSISHCRQRLQLYPSLAPV
jgi:hypothetical protein